jgi:hypothetical protein
MDFQKGKFLSLHCFSLFLKPEFASYGENPITIVLVRKNSLLISLFQASTPFPSKSLEPGQASSDRSLRLDLFALQYSQLISTPFGAVSFMCCAICGMIRWYMVAIDSLALMLPPPA